MFGCGVELVAQGGDDDTGQSSWAAASSSSTHHRSIPLLSSPSVSYTHRSTPLLCQDEAETGYESVMMEPTAEARVEDVTNVKVVTGPLRPMGRVVGIIKRNWRVYCGVLQVGCSWCQEAGGGKEEVWFVADAVRDDAMYGASSGFGGPSEWWWGQHGGAFRARGQEDPQGTTRHRSKHTHTHARSIHTNYARSMHTHILRSQPSSPHPYPPRPSSSPLRSASRPVSGRR